MKQLESILFATSFSECSKEVEESAFALAKDSKATLHIAHVIDGASIFTGGLDLPGTAMARGVELVFTQARHELNQTAERARLQGIDAKTHLVTGNAPADLVKLAEDFRCGLIVIGATSRSALSKLLFGSVSEKVVRRAPCPVLTVRAPKMVSQESRRTEGRSEEQAVV